MFFPNKPVKTDKTKYEENISKNSAMFLKNFLLNKSFIDTKNATKGFFVLKITVGA